MGQFLSMGLAYEISASRDELKEEKISKRELRKEIEKSLLFDLKLYDETETEKRLFFTLKDNVLKTGLIPFLETLLPIVYQNPNNKDNLDLLEKLRTTPPSEWIDLAKEKAYYAFQIDEYGESRYIHFSKPFRPSVRLDFCNVMLYCSHGKIITEGISGMMDFFKYCIQKTFNTHPIAKAVQVYITG